MRTAKLIALIADNPSFELDLDNISTDFTFTRTGDTATKVNSSGIIESVLANVPRIDYSDVVPAFLLEPASTNRITHSEDFSDASWFGALTSKSSDTLIAPNGVSQTVHSIIANAGAGNHILYSIHTGITSAVDCVFSVFVKSTHRYIALDFQRSTNTNHAVAVFDLDTLTGEATETKVGAGSGTIVSTEIVEFPNGWYRLTLVSNIVGSNAYPSVNFASGATGNTFDANTGQVSYNASGTEEIFLYGAEIKLGSYQTSYIKTEGATATRATELCVNGGSASVINSEEGTLIMELASLYDTLTSRQITLSDNTTSNKIVLEYTSTTNQLKGDVIVGGVSQASMTKTLSDSTDFAKVGLKWKANDFALWVNGVEEATDTSGSVFSADTLTEINYNEGDASGSEFYGKQKSMLLYKEALSDSDLESKTT